MTTYPIAVLVGSLRRDSFNRKLATGIASLAPRELTFNQVEGLFDANGDIGSASRKFLQSWVHRYAEWVALHVESARREHVAS